MFLYESRVSFIISCLHAFVITIKVGLIILLRRVRTRISSNKHQLHY